MFVADVFSRAVESGFNQGGEYLRLWTAYLDYLRRRIVWTEGNEATGIIEESNACNRKKHGANRISLPQYSLLCFIFFLYLQWLAKSVS